ncbi:MAG TPA: hypothetical protein DCZ94_19410 [Lentisphaeria bacterium]|nr:MAG: hypothetical protein A2X48_07555 [Lentisphaerae bacterium GWF2_49_21]HBC89112.1 hypothetical protein [Lentisphaeria bacterium]
MKFKGVDGLYCIAMTGIIAAAACILLSGCIKNKFVVKVKKDGSGDIIVTSIFSKETVSIFDMQMKQMKEAGGGGQIAMKDPFYNEEQIKQQGSKFGPDVQFVKAVKYDKDGCRGFVAQYSFPDINKISLSMKDKAFDPESAMMPEGVEPDELAQADKAKDAFKFKFEKGDTAKLKIIGPPVPEKKAEAKEPAKADDKPAVPLEQTPQEKAEIQQLMANGNPLGLTGNETQEQLAKKMFSGLRITMIVEVDGTDIKSNATYKSGDNNSKCTLFDMDMDALMEQPSFMKTMMNGPGGPGMDLLDMYSSTPESKGFLLEKNKETVIEFK